jgi:hypothetical protein
MSFNHAHALIIGIGSYQHQPSKNVPSTVADAQELAKVLRDPIYCGYPENQVTLLSDSSATRASILSALDDLADRINPEDTLLLFYSGHGDYSADGVYQLTTHDTQLEQGHVKTGTAISQTELLDKLRLIPASRLVILINACHAGEISQVLGPDQQPFTGQPLPQQTAEALLSTGEGRIIITACRSGQASYIGQGSLTIFAQALTDGLRGQAFSGRAGYISVFDLYTHLYFTIEEKVERLIPAPLRQGKKMQEPELTILKGVGPYPIALYRGSKTLGDFPTDHLPPKETTPRQVNPARSQWAFEQSLSGAGAVAISGSLTNSPVTTGTNNTVTTSGHDTFQAGGNLTHNSGNVTTGNVSGTGIAIGAGARSHVSISAGSTASLAQAFAPIYTAINARPEDPDVDKQELSETVHKIEQEAQKGPQANESKLSRWFAHLATMAEDIFEVTIAALSGPQAAFATIARKVAAKAKQERDTK